MKNKKIIGIVSAVLVLIVSLCFICCAFINKDYNFKLNEPTSIRVYKNDKVSTDIRNIGDTQEQYAQIMDKFNDSFKISFLNALFQGKGFENPKFVDKDVNQSLSNINSLTDENTYILYFYFDSAQKLMLNGKEVETTWNIKTFTEVYIQVKNTTKLTEINAYIKYSSNYARYKFTTYANQGKLFNYLSENI